LNGLIELALGLVIFQTWRASVEFEAAG
jgi:hypothetical protein